jgi:hypothetical protein
VSYFLVHDWLLLVGLAVLAAALTIDWLRRDRGGLG